MYLGTVKTAAKLNNTHNELGKPQVYHTTGVVKSVFNNKMCAYLIKRLKQ